MPGRCQVESFLRAPRWALDKTPSNAFSVYVGMTAVRPAEPADRAWLAELVGAEWGLPVVSISGAHDPAELPGFVAVADGDLVGAVTYECVGASCEVITLNSLMPGCGIGSVLLEAVRQVSDCEGRRLWVITTDDNARAIDFYQRRGMDLVALHRNFVDVVRLHKPRHAWAAAAGETPFRDALQFSY
jgi:GNAT superfamily N-acetyltransferase